VYFNDRNPFAPRTPRPEFPLGLGEPIAWLEGDAPWGPPRIGVISNPLSGGNRRGRLAAVRDSLQRYPDVVHREVRNGAEVQAALAEFAHRGLNLIVVNSGDGTVQAVLTELLGRRPFPCLPRLALVRGGTTNMTHQELGLNGAPVEGLRRLLDWAHSGRGQAQIRRRSILRVQNASGAPPLYGLFFGAGCIFNGIRFFHSRLRAKGMSGDPAHLMIIARFLWALARRDDALVGAVPAAIRIDRRPLEPASYLLLLVTTLNRLILGLRPFWGRGAGALRVTAVRSRPGSLLAALPALMAGRCASAAPAAKGYVSCRTNEVRLELRGGFALDGELFQAEPRTCPLRIEDGGTVEFVRL
jgi:diacylglycerol kinase (ATP)